MNDFAVRQTPTESVRLRCGNVIELTGGRTVSKAFGSASKEPAEDAGGSLTVTDGSSSTGLLATPMTTRQAADYLGIGENVLRMLCRNRRLRAFKAGGQWRVLHADLMDYIIKQLQKS